MRGGVVDFKTASNAQTSNGVCENRNDERKSEGRTLTKRPAAGDTPV